MTSRGRPIAVTARSVRGRRIGGQCVGSVSGTSRLECSNHIIKRCGSITDTAVVRQEMACSDRAERRFHAVGDGGWADRRTRQLRVLRWSHDPSWCIEQLRETHHNSRRPRKGFYRVRLPGSSINYVNGACICRIDVLHGPVGTPAKRRRVLEMLNAEGSYKPI